MKCNWAAVGFGESYLEEGRGVEIDREVSRDLQSNGLEYGFIRGRWGVRTLASLKACLTVLKLVSCALTARATRDKNPSENRIVFSGDS